MAVVNIYEVAPIVERLVIVDPSAVEDQVIYNKTSCQTPGITGGGLRLSPNS